ncbi:MAG TPA: C1 family peptidase [Acidimicrobiales bacterium]|nr:C1 family peptidase [Acidimicrobiales bacterium]
MAEVSQRKVQRYGWIPDIPDARDHIFAIAPEMLASLPPSVDLRADMPPVYDQGQLGSCTANAIGAAYQYMQRKQKLGDLMPSRLFVYYNERVMEHTVDSDAGAMIRDGIKSVAQAGVCSEDLWPYDIAQFKTRPSAECYKAALDHQAIAYRRVVSTSLHQIQGALAGGTPVVFGFSVYDAFESAEVAKTGEVPLPRGGTVLGGHAVLAVGYDDATQRFLVRNSWGPDWGLAGYCTMPYAYLTNSQLASDFWAIDTVEAPAAAATKTKRAAKAKAAKKATKAARKAAKPPARKKG